MALGSSEQCRGQGSAAGWERDGFGDGQERRRARLGMRRIGDGQDWGWAGLGMGRAGDGQDGRQTGLGMGRAGDGQGGRETGLGMGRIGGGQGWAGLGAGRIGGGQGRAGLGAGRVGDAHGAPQRSRPAGQPPHSRRDARAGPALGSSERGEQREVSGPALAPGAAAPCPALPGCSPHGGSAARSGAARPGQGAALPPGPPNTEERPESTASDDLLFQEAERGGVCVSLPSRNLSGEERRKEVMFSEVFSRNASSSALPLNAHCRLFQAM